MIIKQKQKQIEKQQLVVIRDTREQTGYLFNTIVPKPTVIDKGLKTGDYSIEGYENEVTVERKSLADAYGSFGRGRKRFELELGRMSKFRYAAVVIEADWLTIIKSPPVRSQMKPKAVFASIIAWSIRYKVQFYTCPDRWFAEKLTYRILERYWKDNVIRIN